MKSKQYDKLVRIMFTHHKHCTCSLCCCVDYWTVEDDQIALSKEANREITLEENKRYAITNEIIRQNKPRLSRQLISE